MEFLNILMAIISIILGVISIVIAIKSNNESIKINQDTERKLIEIKNLSDNISKTSDRIENNIKTQIDRIINSNAPTQDEKMQHELLTTVLPAMVSNPEILARLIEIGNGSSSKQQTM